MWFMFSPRKMKVTKFIAEAGCDLATGWDGAHLDGLHPTGYEMRVTVTRSMRDPRHVRFCSTIDGSIHIDGDVQHPVERESLDIELPAIWERCLNAPSAYRQQKGQS